MGSATQQAVASGRAALAKATGAGLTLGRELLAAETVLADSAQLRAAFADAAADQAAKARLVDAVFGKLGAGAKAVLKDLVASRWSTQDDLVAGVEELGVRAIAGSAPARVSIVEELAAFGKAVAGNADLEYAVGSTLVSGAQRQAVVARLLGGKTSEQTVEILGALVANARGRRIGEIVRTATRFAADEAGKAVATVQVARPLAAAQLTRLQKALAAAQGREVAIDQIVDPAVIGGLKVVVGDTVYDGTVAAKLSELRLAFAG